VKKLNENKDKEEKEKEGPRNILFLVIIFVMIIFLVSGFTFLIPEYMPPETDKAVSVTVDHSPETPEIGDDLVITAVIKNPPSNYSTEYEIKFFEDNLEKITSSGNMIKVGENKFQHTINLSSNTFSGGMTAQYAVSVKDPENNIIFESEKYFFSIIN
jgi:hypothetical protein